MNDIPRLPTTCGGPSLQVLRRYETSELTGEERATVQRHVESCASCQDVMRDFAADRAVVRSTLPFTALEARLQRRPNLFVRWWRRLALGAAVPALGAVAFVVWSQRTAVETDSKLPPGINVKGSSCDLGLVVAAPGRDLHPWTAEEALHPGDRLELQYKSLEKPYAIVVGVDADGTVFPYLTSGERSFLVDVGKQIDASTDVTLDEDPRPERVFMLCSSEPLSLDEVRAAAKDGIQRAGTIDRLTELSIPKTQQTSHLLKKDSR